LLDWKFGTFKIANEIARQTRSRVRVLCCSYRTIGIYVFLRTVMSSPVRASQIRQRPPLFAAALKAAKATLDPLGLLNPGVLIDP
jgi:hypothetical protein